MGKPVTVVHSAPRGDTGNIMDDGDEGGAVFLPLWRRPSHCPHDEVVAEPRSRGIEGSPVRDQKVHTYGVS